MRNNKMKILSILPAQPGWFAKFFYPPHDGKKGWYENCDVVVWGVIEDVDGQRIVGFCAGLYGPLFMGELDNKECNFTSYVYEEQQPTNG